MWHSSHLVEQGDKRKLQVALELAHVLGSDTTWFPRGPPVGLELAL